jgi:iron complex outermembrane receptor protein
MSANLKNAIRAINKSALLYGSVGAMAFTGVAGVANAQELQTEEVVVTGIRASLEQALDIKRNAGAVVDAINAEDIGKFPDKNVAESLSRITGVAVSREFGEGEKITVRGAGPSTNRTLLNGQTIASADWFILDEATRSFNYTLLPSVLVSNLEVYKTPVASMDEGSIGGTVVLRTRRPLDLDANAVSVAVEAQYSEVSGETDPQIAAQYSWKDSSDRYGFLISAVRQDRTVVREGVEILGWRTTAGEKVPSHIGVPRFEQSRERQTLFLSLQAQPTDEWDIVFNALNSELDSDNKNQNLLILPNNQAVSGDLTNKTVVNGSVVAAESDTGTALYNYINRVSSTETESYDLDVTYSTEAYTVHAQVGTTEASGGTLRETSWEYGASTGYSYDLTDGVSANLTDVDPADASAFGAGWIWGGNKPASDEETYAQLDFELPLEFGAFVAFKTGVKLRDHSRSQERNAFSWHGPGTVPEGTDADNYLGYIFENCPTLATCGLDAEGTVTIDTVASGNLVNQVGHNRTAMESIAFGGLNGVPADYAISMALAENWTVDEKHKAFYVQGDFEGDNFRGNVGVRYVQTDQTSGGYDFSGDSWGFLTVDREWLTPAHLEWVEVENDYSEVLPSFNIAFDLTEDQILRFAAARVMSRQNFATISNSSTFGSLNQAEPTGTYNNPFMNPQIANQFDVSWEWYFAETSLLSATYFYKDIQSYPINSTFVEPRFNEDTQEWVDVTFTRPDNGPGGKTDGLELSYQQDFGGMGVIANYTYTNVVSYQERDPAVPGSALVPGPSEHMANLTGYYENDAFSARLMYNYRTEWYKGLHFNGDELWNDTFGQWDASLTYNVTDNISLSIEGVNLLNEEVVEYNTDKVRVMSIYENGRRVIAGVRMNF